MDILKGHAIVNTVEDMRQTMLRHLEENTKVYSRLALLCLNENDREGYVQFSAKKEFCLFMHQNLRDMKLVAVSQGPQEHLEDKEPEVPDSRFT